MQRLALPSPPFLLSFALKTWGGLARMKKENHDSQYSHQDVNNQKPDKEGAPSQPPIQLQSCWIQSLLGVTVHFFYLLKVSAISILGSLHSCFLGSLLLRLGPTLSPRRGIKMWGQLVLCCADFMQLIFILETIMFYAVNTDYLFCQLGYKLS